MVSYFGVILCIIWLLLGCNNNLVYLERLVLEMTFMYSTRSFTHFLSLSFFLSIPFAIYWYIGIVSSASGPV